MPPIWYATYRFGAWLLDLPPRDVDFTLSLENLLNNMQGIWKPLILGSFATALSRPSAASRWCVWPGAFLSSGDTVRGVRA